MHFLNQFQAAQFIVNCVVGVHLLVVSWRTSGCVGRQLLRRQVVFAAYIGCRLSWSSLVPCPADSAVIGLQLRMYLALQRAMCEGLLGVRSKRYQKKTISGGADVCIDTACKRYCTNVYSYGAVSTRASTCLSGDSLVHRDL